MAYAAFSLGVGMWRSINSRSSSAVATSPKVAVTVTLEP
jgi:hypothetical protein